MDPSSFANRVLQQQRLFVSYTPTELALRRATLERPVWVKTMENTAGMPLERHQLEDFFISYIERSFPLRMADPVDFAQFILQELQKKQPARFKPDDWWFSKPSGQTNYQYPQMSRDEPSSFDLLR